MDISEAVGMIKKCTWVDAFIIFQIQQFTFVKIIEPVILLSSFS